MAQFGARTGLLRRRKVIASWTTMTVFAAALTVYAVSHRGYPVEHASLNDGGIWVTNPSVGLGRENRPIEQLDARVPCAQVPCPGVDVLQDGDAVFQAVGNTILPVNVARASTSTTGNISVDAAAQRALAGGTLAILDPRTGAIHAARVTPDPWTKDGNAQNTGVSTVSGALAKAIGPKVGAKGVLAVGTDGTVYAAQGSRLATIAPSRDGFDEPQTTDLSPTAAPATTNSTEQATAVGDTFVYPSGRSGTFGVNGHTVALSPEAALQQPSAASSADAVFIGTADGITAVDLDSGKPTSVYALKDQPAPPVPSRPVRLQDCTYEAWWQSGGVSTIVTSCDDGTVVEGTLAQTAIPGCEATTPLVLRTNHDQVVVNDVCNGPVYPFGSGKVQPIADWKSLVPVIKPDPNPSQTPTITHKVVAKRETLGVRAGGETVLHVLDNDSGPSGAVLAIDSLDTSTVPDSIRLFMSPDRQSIVAHALPGAPATAEFSYTVSDGAVSSTAAADTLDVVPANAPLAKPELRPTPPKKLTYPVAVGGTVQIPVADRWRDPHDGDPITIQSAGAGAFVTPEGMLAYSPASNASAGPVTITLTLGTGGPTVTDTATVDVVTKGTKDPQLEPDVASGKIVGGQPATITVSPLANDLPGADASDPFASLALASVAPLTRNSPAVGVVDKNAGTFQITAPSPGQYKYSYAATFGSVTKTSTVRVVVTKESSASPVAMPDTTTLFGNQPKTVDVLANDFDPLGRVLVLQSAQAPPGSNLSVGVVANRWLRVSTTNVDGNPPGAQPQTITYSVAAASGAETQGSVTVVFGSSKQQDTPVTPDVNAVVRAGDTVSIPVLDGASVPSGASVSLLVPDKGALDVETNDEGDRGTATIAGTHVRYVAPLVTSPIQVSVPYTVYNQSLPGFTHTGYARIKVVPAPRPVSGDQAPTPLSIVARAIQGNTIDIKIPDLGMDPEGDSVSVIGIGDPTSDDPTSTVPQKGQVLSSAGNTIRYQAFPNASGTDTFSYVVSDTYGKTAAGTVRVGVGPGSGAQQPVPVNDFVRLDPQRQLAYNVTANDIKEPGTTLTLAPFSVPVRGVTEDSTNLHLAPGLGTAGSTVPFPYLLEGPTGPIHTPGSLNVTYEEGFDNPPVAGTVMAAPRSGATSVVVSFKDHIGDVDDDSDRLDVGDVHSGARTATVQNGSVNLPLLAAPTVWSYTVTDRAGASSSGAIYVPAKEATGPYLRRNAVIHVDPGKTAPVDIKSYVADSDNKAVILTSTNDWSWSGDVRNMASDNSSTSFKVTAGRVAGVGQVSFPVTDAPTATSTAGVLTMITIPVVVGDPPPVLHCPDEPVVVYDQGADVPINVAQYCHVWTADPGQAPKLSYSTSQNRPSGLHAPVSGATVTLSAAGVPGLDCARPTSSVPGTVSVAATGAARSTLNVSVQCLPLATFTTPPPYATTTKAKTLPIDLTQNLHTDIRQDRQHKEIVKIVPVGNAPNTLSAIAGTARLTFTANGQHGNFKYRLTLNDAGKDAARNIFGTIEIDVIGPPGAPRNVQWVHRNPNDLLTEAAKISFDPPVDDGNDPNGIAEYYVGVNGGTPRSYNCHSSPCQVTGLSNSDNVSLTVYSKNAVGLSKTGTTVSGVAAGKLPTAPLNPKITAVGNGAGTIAWSPPSCSGNTCGDIKGYELTYSGGSGPAQTQDTSVEVHGTNGTPVTVTIAAQNSVTNRLKQLGVTFAKGATVAGTVTPAGHPGTPQFLAPEPTSPAAPSDAVEVNLRWTAVAANGPGYDSSGAPYYRVTSTPNFNEASPVCPQVQGTSCPTSVPSDGQVHTFYVWAWNTGGTEGEPESSTSNPADYRTVTPGKSTIYGASKPEPVSNVSIRPSGSLYTATASLTYGKSHDTVSDIYCRVGSMSGQSCGHWTGNPGGGTLNNVTVNTSNSMGQQTLYFFDQNSGKGVQGLGVGEPGTAQVDIYGTPGASIDQLNAVSGTSNVQWHVNVSPEGRDVDWTLSARNQANGSTQTVASGTTYQANGQGQGAGNTFTGAWSTTYTFKLTVVGHAADPNGGPDPQASDQKDVRTYDQPPPPGPTETITQTGSNSFNLSWTNFPDGAGTYYVKCWNAAPHSPAHMTDPGYLGVAYHAPMSASGSLNGLSCPTPPSAGTFSIEIQGEVWNTTIQWQ